MQLHKAITEPLTQADIDSLERRCRNYIYTAPVLGRYSEDLYANPDWCLPASEQRSAQIDMAAQACAAVRVYRDAVASQGRPLIGFEARALLHWLDTLEDTGDCQCAA